VQRAMRLARERHAKGVVDLKIRRMIKQLSAREQEVLRGLLDGRISARFSGYFSSDAISIAGISPHPTQGCTSRWLVKLELAPIY
jgi:hypothetical protein